MDNPQTYFDDEIDLREIVATLWRGRWIIIALTLMAAVAAFSISKWVMPKIFQTTAMIAITKPVIQFEDINDILYNASIPDANYIKELAVSPTFLDNIVTSPQVIPFWDAENDSIYGMVEANIIGKNQLQLRANDTDPERAALLVNTWADQIVADINQDYGVDMVAHTLDAQVKQAEGEAADAQATLETILLQSDVNIFQVQLEITKNDLSCVLERSSAATRILEDLQVLEQGIKGLPSEAFLALGDAMALTTLQQRTSASQICAGGDQTTLLEVGNDTLVSIPVIDALNAISQLREALQSQQITLSDEQSRLEGIIPSLESNLAKENYHLETLIIVRDQKQGIYTTLLEQQARVRNVLMTNAKVATVDVRGIVTDDAVGPKVLLNTALVGTLGLMLGVVCVFIAGWWRETNNDVDLDISAGE